MRRVADPLRAMGATVEGRAEPARPGDIFPPVRVRGGALTGIRYDLPVASAQLKSALVLAALQAAGASALREPARSRDHTERMLATWARPSPSTPTAWCASSPTAGTVASGRGRIVVPGTCRRRRS